MASTLLEQTRESHEECERLERFVVGDMKADAITHKQRLRQGHRVSRALDAMVVTTKRLRSLYKDHDRAMAEELVSFGELPAGGTKDDAIDPGETIGGDREDENFGNAAAGDSKNNTAFAAFHDRISEIRTYHEQQPGMFAPSCSQFLVPFKDDVELKFSGEESNGRFLDVHAFHGTFQNASFGETNCSYVEFLADVGCAQMRQVPRSKKFAQAYREYLAQLKAYLTRFAENTQPLSFRERDDASDSDFDQKWQEGQIAGWEDRGIGAGAGGVDDPKESGAVSSVLDDLRLCATLADVQRRFADPVDVTSSLKTLGLKQGGTQTQKLERLFAVRHVSHETYPNGVDAKLFAKGFAVARVDAKKAEEKAKAVARVEHGIDELLTGTLKLVLQNTKAMIEKKQTLTAAELEQDALEDSDFVESEDDDDGGTDFVNNPLKLPLGFDGKPIPYWLYKLHGLNVQFTCEICGNATYWGRRAYETHFKESRHQHGMRCLKIPNTRAFAEITTIAEALALHKSLESKDSNKWDKQTDEEYEDADGNVYNRKTFEDLKRQGLI